MAKLLFPRDDGVNESRQSVPREYFDTGTFPPEERLAAFRRLTGPLFDVWAQEDANDFDLKATGHSVGPFVSTQVYYNSPARFLRGPAHIQGDGKDYLVLEIMLEGEQSVVMPKTQLRCHAGHIYLRDWSHEFKAYASAMRLNSLVIPRDVLKASADLTADNPVLSWSIAEPDGRTLSLLWSSLLAEFERATLNQAEALCAAFVGFLDGLLVHGNKSQPPASLSAMQQYLNARLRGNVTTDELCRHFNVSRSKLYRIFERVGGVRQYVTHARLERCFTELLVADPKKVKVSEVASSWGFNEASSFTRSFRNKFNTAPSKVLGMAHTLEQHSAISDGVSNTEYCKNYLGWFQAASNSLRMALPERASTGSPRPPPRTSG